MDTLKILITLLGIGAFSLLSPPGARAEEPSSPSGPVNPFASTQGEVGGSILYSLFSAPGQNQTPGFGPIMNLATSMLFSSALGPNVRPIFMQNNQDLGTFISGLKNQSPAQLHQLFTHDLLFGSTGGEAEE